MYFESFPLIPYDSAGNGISKDVTNIFRRVAVRAKVKSNTALFDTYDVRDGETPEMIAHRLYDDATLHWVILLFNEIHDRYHQWPMSTIQFEDYLKDKYGDNINSVHHYEITEDSGHNTKKIDVGTVNTDYPAATAITNREHEEDLQNSRRRTKLLDPRFIADFAGEFKRSVRERVI